MICGYLKIILGPMFSGKTTYLIDKYNELIALNQHAIVINHSLDNRYSNTEVVAHDGKKIPCLSIKNLNDLYNGHEDIFSHENKYILINEAQFFDDIVEMVILLVEKYNKYVFISGLDGDFKRKKFGNILDLIPISDEVIKLKSICKCGNAASFSRRISNEKEQISIGNDNYEPVCRNCYR
jgi:thymidine kinase